MFSFKQLQENDLYRIRKIKLIKDNDVKFINYFENLIQILDNDYKLKLETFDNSSNSSDVIYIISCTEQENIDGMVGFLSDFYNYNISGNKIFIDLSQESNVKKFVSGHRFNKNKEVYTLCTNCCNKRFLCLIDFNQIKNLHENFLIDIVDILVSEQYEHWDSIILFEIVDKIYFNLSNQEDKKKIINLLINKKKPLISILYSTKYKFETIRVLSEHTNNVVLVGKNLNRISVIGKDNEYKISIEPVSSKKSNYEIGGDWTFDNKNKEFLIMENNLISTF